MSPQPLQILVCSQSDATLAFFKTMFNGFHVTLISSIPDTKVHLRGLLDSHPPLDFLILDDQSEAHADDLARFLHALRFKALQETKLIHLYTPTTSSGHAVFSSNTPGVIKMTKPPRTARLLQTLAGLKDLPNTISSTQASDVAKAIEDMAAAQRTLFGNILVAEGMTSCGNDEVRFLIALPTRQSYSTESLGEAIGAVPAQCYCY